MTPDQALALIDKACAEVVANRASHEALKEALRVLAEAIKPKK